jgi:hypothetical protein
MLRDEKVAARRDPFLTCIPRGQTRRPILSRAEAPIARFISRTRTRILLGRCSRPLDDADGVAQHGLAERLLSHAFSRDHAPRCRARRFVVSYCLMPNRIHLIWMGLRRDTVQRNGNLCANISAPRCCDRIAFSTRHTTTYCGNKSVSGEHSPGLALRD